MPTKQPWLQKHALLAYFLLAFAISWAIGIPLALIAQGKLNWHLPCQKASLALTTRTGKYPPCGRYTREIPMLRSVQYILI
jgi:hypothetical protein